MACTRRHAAPCIPADSEGAVLALRLPAHLHYHFPVRAWLPRPLSARPKRGPYWTARCQCRTSHVSRARSRSPDVRHRRRPARPEAVLPQRLSALDHGLEPACLRRHERGPGRACSRSETETASSARRQVGCLPRRGGALGLDGDELKEEVEVARFLRAHEAAPHLDARVAPAILRLLAVDTLRRLQPAAAHPGEGRHRLLVRIRRRRRRDQLNDRRELPVVHQYP
eukprot:2641312-Rhodomonas_salina.2